MKLKCFVACAFGRPEVDETYEIIKSVLESLDIISLRVDKLDFNDKIDAKIIQQIDVCDFGLADLTFARPSVYYEAGRIHGLGREVIFTCRADHVGGTEDGQKIHFDLLMYNIIKWKSDQTLFRSALKRRVEKVILPLQKARDSKLRIDEEERIFNHLSSVQKFEKIRTKMVEIVNQAKYDILDLGKYEPTVFGGRNGRNSKDEVIFGFIDSTYTAAKIKDVLVYDVRRVTEGINKGFKDKKTKLDPSFTTVIITSLSRITDRTIQKTLGHYSKMVSTEKIYFLERNGKTERFIFIDNIKSLSEFQNRLASVLS